MSPTIRTLEDLKATGKYVVLRADLNVPFKDGKVTDNSRLTALVPTLNRLKKMGAKTIILSHFGRPKSKDDKDLSLAPIANELSKVIGENIVFFDDKRPDLKDGQIAVKENTRFDPREEKNDATLAKEFAELGDYFVNDAFSAAHRAHASTEGITHYLESYSGLLMEEEVMALEIALNNPEKPLIAFVGGAKISTKLDLLNNLVKKTDILALGGGMANTFLFAKGVDLGKSLCEKDMIETAQQILKTAKEYNCEIILPVDALTAKEFKAGVPHEEKSIEDIQSDDLVLDIGPRTVELIKKSIDKSKTLIWNGPFGVFEIPPFDSGTTALAQYVAERTQSEKLISVAGGGDTISALNHASVTEKLTYASLAGGAFLEWLEGKELPGVKALKN